MTKLKVEIELDGERVVSVKLNGEAISPTYEPGFGREEDRNWLLDDDACLSLVQPTDVGGGNDDEEEDEE